MTRHAVVFVALSCALLSCKDDPKTFKNSPGEVQILYIVRHAEKKSGKGNDPELTELGRKRAAGLVGALADRPVDAIFASQFRRTQQTVASLAETRALKPKIINCFRPDRLVKAVDNLPVGAAAMISGHSNTIPDLLKRLGVETPVEISNEQYGDIFVIRRQSGGPARLSRRRFEP